MTPPQTILAIVGGLIGAARQAVAFAEQLGVGEDAIAALKRIEAKANEEAGRLLPAEALALGLFAQHTARHLTDLLGTLPPVERCPNDGDVLTIRTVAGLRWTVCKRPGCGFDSRAEK